MKLHSALLAALLVAGALLLSASAAPAAPAPAVLPATAAKPVAPVRDTAKSKVKGVRADIAPCSDLDAVEPLLPKCDLTDPETRESISCRQLLKDAGSKELGTEIELGRVRGARFILPANATTGVRMAMGGGGKGALFDATVTPKDDSKPVGITLRAFHGAAKIGERMELDVKDHAFLGTPSNMAGNAIGVITEQCDEGMLQPGTRIVCGVCLLAADNLKELALTIDPSNKAIVTSPLKADDKSLGVIVSGAQGARAAGAVVAGAAALVAALAF